MSAKDAGPMPFDFEDYREFLKDRMAFVKTERGESYRQIAAAAGINSPNYLQRVVRGERSLTLKSAARVAESLGLSGHAAVYFALLVQVSVGDELAVSQARAEMRLILRRAFTPTVENDDIHEDWLYPVIWEMATLADFDLTVETAFERLKGITVREEIERALDFLVRNGHLVPTGERPGRYEQRNATFYSSNDKRRLQAVQTAHRKYLEMAKHRLNDDLSLREFQGLTIAVTKAKMPLVKERLRQLVQALAEELSDDPDAEDILRIECCAFLVTR